MDENAKEEILLKAIDNAIKNTTTPKLYANSFITITGHSDLLIVLQQNTIPVATLNISYTLAKTLALKLGSSIKDLENKTGNTIMTTEDVNLGLVDDVDETANAQEGKDNDET